MKTEKIQRRKRVVGESRERKQNNFLFNLEISFGQDEEITIVMAKQLKQLFWWDIE